MGGRERLDTHYLRRKILARKAGVPLGYSTAYAVKASHKARAEAAALLRALVDTHGPSIPLRWDYTHRAGGVVQVIGDDALTLSRSRCRVLASLGWARLVPTGKGLARLDVDLDALPGGL